jgi:aspartyl-tRNA(Asn)/glutamyl-tRNA(Gln) amidotransferase subunit C
MSQPDPELVRRTAALARLSITDEEARALAPQFARILAAFGTLAELELDDGEAMVRAGGDQAVLRDDEPRPSLAPDAVLRNAPEREDDFYRVPRTVGGDA